MAWLQDRPWARRFLGIGIGLVVLLGIEGFCRLTSLGKPDPITDPFVRFEGTLPLFTTDPLTNTHVTAPERLKYFVEDRFPREKAANTYRIFCLGGSTVQGRPYSIETAFTTWLRLALSTAYPERHFEVINCGGVSYASYRLIPILTECLRYEPDQIILCTGQNEFLEERTYAAARKWQPAFRAASHFRLYHILRNLRHPRQDPGSRPILRQEVDALLDYRGGLEGYERDDDWKRNVQEHFKINIDRLIRICTSAKVPMLVLRPPVNVKDCPPFKSDGNANKFYNLGQDHLARADYRSAKSSLWKAIEEDICPLRLLPGMAKDLETLCHRHQIPYLDLQALLGKECPQGLLGSEILVDHVHPSIRGHQLIANALQEYFEATFGTPHPGSAEDRAAVYQSHLDSLDALYYAHGQQRLRNLHLWTKGRTDGPAWKPND